MHFLCKNLSVAGVILPTVSPATAMTVSYINPGRQTGFWGAVSAQCKQQSMTLAPNWKSSIQIGIAKA
ncbi:hypothetical protein NBRC116594_35620 [Shimia sp. NS0008-38b]